MNGLINKLNEIDEYIRPIIMLSNKEKINELKSNINEQENNIHFLDLVNRNL